MSEDPRRGLSPGTHALPHLSTAGGDRGDNTARCGCGHDRAEHDVDGERQCLQGNPDHPWECDCSGFRPAPAADRQTDEERTRYESHQWNPTDDDSECIVCGVTWQECERECPGVFS